MDEDKLIEGAKAGKQSAHTKLYDIYRDMVRYTVYNIVKNHDAADDLLSIVFTKAFLKIDTYVENISFRMWLKRIAVNSAIDYIRRTKHEQLNSYIDDENCFIQLHSKEKSPEDKYLDQENVINVLEQVETLSVKHRELLKARYIKDLSYKEIALQFDLTEDQVKTGLNKARLKLKQKILPNYKQTA